MLLFLFVPRFFISYYCLVTRQIRKQSSEKENQAHRQLYFFPTCLNVLGVLPVSPRVPVFIRYCCRTLGEING